MSIENTLLLKVGGGLVAAGGAGGAGYYIYTSKLFFGNQYVYLIAKTSGEGTDNLGDLLTENKQNYQCKFINKLTGKEATYDSNCEIYLINEYSDSSNKKIKSDKVIEKVSTKETNATNIKSADKYLKIKINDSYLKNIDFFKEKTVEIVKTDEKLKKTDESVFGKLTPLFWTLPNGNKEDINFPIKYVLVKGKDAGSGTDSVKANSKCFLSDIETGFSCEIWKYNTNHEPTKTGEKITDPKLNQLTKDSGSSNNLSAIDTNNYYVIEFKEDINIDVDSVSKKTFSMTEADSATKKKASNKKEQTFSFENFVIGELSVASHMIVK